MKTSYYELAMGIGRADKQLGVDSHIARTSALPGYADGYSAGQREPTADQWAAHEARGRERAKAEGRLRK